MLPTKATGTTLGTALRLTAFWFLAHGAAPESNRPSVGLPRRTGFEDRLGHRAHAAPEPA